MLLADDPLPCALCPWISAPHAKRDGSRLGPLYLHQKDEWATPWPLFAMLNREFGFTIDVCASDQNAKCHRYFRIADDGLRQDWGREVCFLNPPYSQLAAWLAKAYQSSLRGATVVALTFARTDTAAFHHAVAKASEIRFLRGRIRFGGARHCAPAPSCIIIFRPTSHATPQPCQLSFGFGPAPAGITVRTLEVTSIPAREESV